MKAFSSSASSTPPRRHLALWFALLTLLGIWPALSNSQPFFYPDTPAYIRGADLAISRILGNQFATDWASDPRRAIDPESPAVASELPSSTQAKNRRVVLAGRSIIYGALLYLGHAFRGMWFSVVVQSFMAIWLVFIFIVKTLRLDFESFLIVVGFLFLASPLPFFLSFLMPDVLAGFLILAFAILAMSGDRLNRAEYAYTIAVSVFAVLSHATHLLLLIGLTLMACSWRAARGSSEERIPLRRLLALALSCAVAAIVWESAFFFAVNRVLGAPPVRPPFIMAKLVSITDRTTLAKICATKQFVVCRFQKRFSPDAEAFLWSTNDRVGIFNLADTPTKRMLSDEQLRFAVAVLPMNARHILLRSCQDTFRQLYHTGLGEFVYTPSAAEFLKDRLPARDFQKLAASVAARSDDYFIFGQTFLLLATVLSAITIAMLFYQLSRTADTSGNALEQQTTWKMATYYLLSGIVLNAIICGTLGVVNHRYEARVIWLLQLASISGICVMAPYLPAVFFGSRKRPHMAALRADRYHISAGE